MKLPAKRHIILALLLLYVILSRNIESWGIFYSSTLYPVLCKSLSSFSGLFPFAIGDCFIILALVAIICYPIFCRILKKGRWKSILLHELESLLWIYVWFYIAWGLNYQRPDFYSRTEIPRCTFDGSAFRKFAHRYADSLNACYMPISSIDMDLLRKECVDGYRKISPQLGVMAPPRDELRVKTMVYSPLASKVGVTGSMGPFFCEFTVNRKVRPESYPSTYAHEMSHLLGISSEAEANFYAYAICTASSVKAFRFSGYYSILPYVMGNARMVMEESEYRDFYYRINPEIMEVYKKEREFWHNLYSPLIGEVQNFLYDRYLKSNSISSGQKNYSEVIGIVMSCFCYGNCLP